MAQDPFPVFLFAISTDFKENIWNMLLSNRSFYTGLIYKSKTCAIYNVKNVC